MQKLTFRTYGKEGDKPDEKLYLAHGFIPDGGGGEMGCRRIPQYQRAAAMDYHRGFAKEWPVAEGEERPTCRRIGRGSSLTGCSLPLSRFVRTGYLVKVVSVPA